MQPLAVALRVNSVASQPCPSQESVFQFVGLGPVGASCADVLETHPPHDSPHRLASTPLIHCNDVVGFLEQWEGLFHLLVDVRSLVTISYPLLLLPLDCRR